MKKCIEKLRQEVQLIVKLKFRLTVYFFYDLLSSLVCILLYRHFFGFYLLKLSDLKFQQNDEFLKNFTYFHKIQLL